MRQGDAGGQFALGNMYRSGLGIEKDEAAAVQWFLKAATQGHVRAQNNLAFMFREGRGVQRDLPQAARWYRRAAEQGDPYAQYNLGASICRALASPLIARRRSRGSAKLLLMEWWKHSRHWQRSRALIQP